MDLLAHLLVGAAAFVATNVDDLFLLVVLFADPVLRPRSIVAGQLAGIGGLVAASALSALAAVAVPERWTALLGVLPLGLGLHQLWIRHRRSETLGDPDPRADGILGASGSGSQLLAVAALTVASGCDNLAVYIPLFARAPGAIPLHAATFGLLTCAWCWIGHRLLTRRLLADPIRRYGHRLLPLVLVALGLYVLSGVLASGI